MSDVGRAQHRRRDTPHPSPDDRRAMEAIFLDVGHGCCTIIVTPNRRAVVMVDCKFGAGPLAMEYLRENGLADPSAFFISHMHDDHVAGFADIFRKLVDRDARVERVYANYVGKTTHKRSPQGGQAVVDQLRELLDGDLGRLRGFHRPERAWGSDGVTFRILHPDRFDLHTHQDRHDMFNDLSGVLRVEFGQSSVLLPGDIKGWAVARLLRSRPKRLRSSLLLFPHHGAGWQHVNDSGDRLTCHGEDLSPPAAFVHAVAATWTVLSVGTDNDGNWEKWRHPSTDVLDALRTWHDASPGHVVCTEVTRHCEPSLCSNRPRVPCGGHVRFRLYDDGTLDLATPEYGEWRRVVRGWCSPQCLTTSHKAAAPHAR